MGRFSSGKGLNAQAGVGVHLVNKELVIRDFKQGETM